MTERNPNRNEETGKYSEAYNPDDALEALRDLDGAATTSEVAEEVGCARRTAYNKLVDLEEEGRVRSRTSGRTRLWFLQEEK